MEKKTEAWLPLRSDRVPPSGWIKAIRGALGINASQLAGLLGITPAAIRQFEQNEVRHKISIETIEKVSRAMGCQLVYAIVPQVPFSRLEAILDSQATKVARSIVSNVDHTMKLEEQGIGKDKLDDQVREIAHELKENLASRLWTPPKKLSKRKSSK